MGTGPEVPPPPEDNPFEAPNRNGKAGGWVKVLPGWVIFLFAVVAASVPFFLKTDRIDHWINAVMYGLPAGVTVLVFAPTNIRLGREKFWSIASLILIAAALVMLGLRINGMA